MIEIVDVVGREILDSRGNPTVEVEVYLEYYWKERNRTKRWRRRSRDNIGWLFHVGGDI